MADGKALTMLTRRSQAHSNVHQWTAFGVMLGNIMGVAFGGLAPNLAWRLMLGSTTVLPLIVCAQVYFCPESPRSVLQALSSPVSGPDCTIGGTFNITNRKKHSDPSSASD